VIAASIVLRLGIIEALLRFYYQAGEDPDQVVKTAFASLLWTTTIGLAIAMPLAEPISRLLLDHSDASLMRIAIFGLWVFTMYEFLTALFGSTSGRRLTCSPSPTSWSRFRDGLAGRGGARAPAACSGASTAPEPSSWPAW
jgi:hypothetical protein